MDKTQILEMMATVPVDELAKAVKDAKGLEGIRIIKDLWEDYHAIPDRNDTKTGPAMHSSGSGADKAIAEYSHPAPQVGLTEMYKEFTDKNIEGWGKMHEAFKSMGDKVETGLAALLDYMKKADEEKAEEKKEEMHKDPDPEPDPDPAKKSVMSEKITATWDALSELEAAYAKAEGHDETKDIAGLQEAREHIEKAEKELERVEEHEKEEQAHMKANVYINLGWKSLAKATGLNSYDLKGYGNQKDEAVTGDSTSDQSKHDLKKAEAKASYYTLKADRIRKSLGIIKKDETPVVKDETPVVAVQKDPDPTPDPDPKSKAELDALKADMDKTAETIKSFNERISFLNQRIEEVSGRKMTPMVPVVLKSAGIKSDNIANSLHEKIEASVEAGELTEDNAGIARNLVGRYMAAGKGHIAVDIVNQQLERAPLEVQNFFSHLEATV